MPLRFVALCLALLAAGCSADAAKRRAYGRGKQYLAAGQFPEAIIEFHNAIARDDRWGQARLKLADAYAANAEPDLAYRQYIRAADLLPDDADAQLKAASYLLLAGQFDDARARAEHVLARDADNVEAQVIRGSAMAGLRDLDAAIRQISEAIQLDPSRSQSYVALARVHVAQGRADEARAAFEKAVATDNNSVAAHLARANFQWSAGEIQAAEKSLKRVLEIDPDNILTRRALAALYLDANRVPDAEEHLRFVADHSKTTAAQLSMADYYLLSQRYGDARRVLELLTADVITRGAAETRLANLLYAEGSKEEARQLLATVLAREPNNDAAHALTARWLLDEGKPLRALDHLQSALSANPQHVPALYLKATAEARLHRTADAVKTLLDVLRVNPRDAIAQTQLSALHLARNQVESAVHVAEEALSNAPKSADARLALARALTARGDFTAAAAEIATVKQRAPNAADAYAVEGALLVRSGNRRAARAAFEQALQRDPDSREALKGLTMIDVVDGSAKTARARLEPRLGAFESDPELLLLSAKTFLATGDLVRAEQLCQQAVALVPLNIEGATLLARVLTQQRRLDAALSALDAEAAREPSNLAARLMAAIVVHTQGNIADATARYQSVLKLEPRAVLAANNLAAIYADRGTELAEAQRLAEFAVEQLPTHAGLRDTLGTVYLKRNLLGPAIVQFRESVAAEPANPLYHYRLGLALAKSGDRRRARDAFDQAIKLDPRLNVAQRALGSLN